MGWDGLGRGLGGKEARSWFASSRRPAGGRGERIEAPMADAGTVEMLEATEVAEVEALRPRIFLCHGMSP